MAGNRVQYIIDLVVQDKQLRQQMAQIDWEKLVGSKGKGIADAFSKGTAEAAQQIQNTFHGLNIDWNQILGTKEVERLEQQMARVLSNSKNQIKAFSGMNDVTGIQRTVEYVTALGNELKGLGSNFDAAQLARGMTSFMKVLDPLSSKIDALAKEPAKIEAAFDRLFNGKMMGGANQSVEKIATAMARLGVDKSALTNIKQVRAEMDKLAQDSKIKLEIDYGSLSDVDLLGALRQKHGNQKLNLNELLDFEWNTQIDEMIDAEGAKLEKSLAHILALESRIKKYRGGQSPLDAYTFEGSKYEGWDIQDLRDTLHDLRAETDNAVKETMSKLDQGVKAIQQSITEKLGQLAAVKIDLILDEANKAKFKSSIDAFITDLNANKYGEFNRVTVDLNLNNPEKTTKAGRPKSAALKDIEHTKSSIQQALQETQEEYNKLNDVLNNSENGLVKKLEQNPENGRLAGSVKETQLRLKELEKTMATYNYMLHNMDDYDFAKSVVSDWKKFSSAEKNILLSQERLLTKTRQWRNEMNESLRFRYEWKVDGADLEFDRMAESLQSISDRRPIQLTPDIDYMVNAIESGLAGREIKVKLAADGAITASGGVVGNLGMVPTMSFGSMSHITPTSTSQAPISSQTPSLIESFTETYIDTDVDAIIKFVEEQVDAARRVNQSYAELLNDVGISDSDVSSYIKNVKNKATEIPKEIISKYGNEKIFLDKLAHTKQQVNANNKSPFFGVAEQILGLKSVIESNPADSLKVQEATDQIKNLLISSVVNSFEAYIKQSKERYARNEEEIVKQTQIKNNAMQAYNSDAEKQKRLDRITAKQQEINTLESNTAIAEYRDLLELIKMARQEGDTKSLAGFLKQERETLPGVKQGYQNLIAAKQQLLDLYKEDPNDKNLLAMTEAEKKIASAMRSNKKITASRQAYAGLGISLDELEGFINAGDNKSVYDLITNKVLNNPGIVNSMGARRKTSEAIDPMYLFDTSYQKMITATVDMVQKAIGLAQKTTAELERQAMNKSLLGDLRAASSKRAALSSIKDEFILSSEEFSRIDKLFSEDLENARQMGEGGATTDREMAYVKFAQALDGATQAAEGFRGIYESWTLDERQSFRDADDKQQWFEQKYANKTDAAQNYASYLNYDTARQALSDSISFKKAEDGKPGQYGIYNEVAQQLKGYVFRVTLVDNKGTPYTVGVGTEKLVGQGALTKPDQAFKAGSLSLSKFLAGLPEDLSNVLGINFYGGPGRKGRYEQPSNIEAPIAPSTKTESTASQRLAKAKGIIDRANRVVDESATTISVQEILEVVNEELTLAEQRASSLSRQINSMTGGFGLEFYKEDLIQQREQIKSSSTLTVNKETNKVFAQADKMVADATKEANIANQIAKDPLNPEWNKLFADKLPSDIQRLSEILQTKMALGNTLPKSQEEALQIQSKISELSNQERILRQSIEQWAKDISTERDKTIQKADQMKAQEAPALAKTYQKELVGLVNEATSLSQQLESDPNNEALKTQMQGIVNQITQLSTLYKDLLNKYNLTTKGFLGNEYQKKTASAYAAALQIYNNPTDESLWGSFDKLPESVYKSAELVKRDSELTKLIPKLPEDQRKLMEAERLSIAAEYKKEMAKVLQWVNSQKGVEGTGALAGIGSNSSKFKNAQAVVSAWEGKGDKTTTTVNPRQEVDRINTQIREAGVLESQLKTQIQIVENKRKLQAILSNQLEIEKELADTSLTAEARSRLERAYANNQNLATELGVKARKFADTSVGEEKLQGAYVEAVNALIDQQAESDAKIREINSSLEREKQRLQRLEAERTQDKVAEGKRLTQDSAIKSEVALRASNLAKTQPGIYAQLRSETESEYPVVDYYDYQNPYEHQERAIQAALAKKAEAYVWSTITAEEEQKIINEAIASQKRVIAENETKLQAERAHNHEIVAQRDRYKQEGQVTDEMIAARRGSTEAIRREAQIISGNTTEATGAPYEPIRESDTHYQTYTGGQAYQYASGVYNIDTSHLATEGTLNAIYMLLSGDASRSGLSDVQRAALEEERAAIRSQLGGKLGRNVGDVSADASEEELKWLMSQGVDVKLNPQIQPGAIDNAINEEVKSNPPSTSTIKAVFADGTPFEGSEEELQNMISVLGEPIQKIVQLSEQQAVNEQMKTIETEKQLENEIMESSEQANSIASLKAREAEIDAQLSADDEFKASQSANASANGGIVGIMNSLAKDNTLREVLHAVNEIAKRQVSSISGKGNSAQDLLMRLQNMLAVGANQNKERVAYVDLATGAMTDSIEGTSEAISGATLSALRQAYQNSVNFDAQVHTHANADDPYFSPADLKYFADDVQNGITKQILLSKNNMTVLDMANVQDVNGLLDALINTEHNFEALSAAAERFGATYLSSTFDEITPQGLVKMLGIKGIESKYTETETRDSAVSGMLAEDAKEAADVLQESTGRAVKKTVERVGAELMTTTEKTDAKGNKTWSKQITDKYTKAALATNKAFGKLGLADQFGVGTEAQVALDDYTNKYNQFIDLVNRFKQNPQQDGLQDEFNRLLPELDAAEAKLNKLIVAKDRFMGNKEPLTIFNNASLQNAGDSLKSLATSQYASTLGLGDNMAFNGISETPNGTRLLVDVLKNGTISQYALEVDRATGQVKEFMVAETALANAFQNVNKAMKQNEFVMADVAIGNNPTQQQQFMSTAKSPEWNAYKKALADMEKYVANIWNRMANGGRGASQKELDYIMALSEKVLRLGKDVQKTSADFKNFWAQNPDNVTALNIGIKTRGKNVPTRDEQVRAEMEKYAQINAAANNSEYAFSSFDNDKLQYTLTDVEGNVRRVTLVWNELYQQIATVSDKSVSALDPVVAKIEDYRNKLQQAVDNKFISDNDKNLQGFNNTNAEIQNLINSVNNGTVTFDSAKNKLAQLRQEAIEFGVAANATAKSNERLYAGTNELRAAGRQRDKIVGLYGDGFADSDSTSINAYIAAYRELIQLYERLNSEKMLFDASEQEGLRQKAIQVQALGGRLLSSVKEAQNLRELVEGSGVYTDWAGGVHQLGGVKENLTAEEVAASNLKNTMIDYAKNGLGMADLENIKFNKTTQQLTGTLRISNDAVADIAIKYNEATNALYAYNKQERESLMGLRGAIQGFKTKFRSIMMYTTSITSIYRVFSMLRQAVQYVRDIDSALTELKKVTEATEETYDRFLDTASKTAGKIGSTIQEVVSSTADFARLGYTMQEAATMAESAQVLMNVSEFNDISTATDSLISSIQAFKYTANETMDVVDILNTIGNNYAISTADLATSLTKSSGSLVAANGTMEEAVALTATANTIIQDPDVVGTALKTVAMRLRGTDIKTMEEEGLDVDGVVTTKSKLRGKIKGLSGIDILTDDGAYKSTYQILSEIAEVWESINDMDQAALLELLAGKRAGSVMSAILQNPETLKDAFESAGEATGSALAENEKYLDSIQGKMDLFTNSLQTMWNNTLTSDFLKTIIDIGTQLLKWVDNLGLIKALFIGIGTYVTQKYFKGNIFGNWSSSDEYQNIGEAKSHMASLQGKYEQAQVAYDANHTKDNKKYLNQTRKQYEKFQNSSVGSQIAEYDALQTKLESLNSTRQSLSQELTISQEHEAFLTKKLNAGYEEVAGTVDKVRIKNEGLTNQIGKIDEEIAQTNTQLQDIESQFKSSGNKATGFWQKVKTGATSAWKSVKTFGTQLIQSVATMYLMSTVMETFGKIMEVIDQALDDAIETPEEIQEEFDKLNEKLENTESELRNLESELDTTNDRMDELLQKDTLTLVEQEELNNLRDVSAELERQIELEKTLQQQQQKALNNQGFKAMNSYALDTSFYSEESKTERQGKAEDIGETIGSTAGLIIGGIIGSKLGGNTVIGAAVGSAVLSKAFGYLGSVIEGNSYASELSVKEVLDQMSSIRAGLQADIDEIRDSINSDKDITVEHEESLRATEQSLADFDAALGESVNQINQYLNAVDYSLLTDADQKKQYLDNLKYILKYNIEYGMPDATNIAVKTLFDEKYITEDLKRVKEQIQAYLDAGNNNIDYSDIAISDDAQKQLIDVGITLTDTIATFKELKKTEEESLSIDSSDMVSSIASIAEGVDSLKQAFDEFNESGAVTAETLLKLGETFSALDGWKKYIDLMSSGVASTQEAVDVTNELVEQYLESIIDNPFQFVDDPTTEIDDRLEAYNAYITGISQLRSLGVENSKELIDAMQQKVIAKVVANEIKLYNELNKKKKEGTITEAESQQLEKLGNKTIEERVEAAETKYGVELKNTDLIKDQVKHLETQADLEKIKEDKGKISLSEYQTLAEKLPLEQTKLDNMLWATSNIQWMYTSGLPIQDYKWIDSNNNGWTWGDTKAYAYKDKKTGNIIYDTKDYMQLEEEYKNQEALIKKNKEQQQAEYDKLLELAKEYQIDLSDIETNNFKNDGSEESKKIYEAVYNRLTSEMEAKAAELEAMEKELVEKLDTAFDEIGLEVVLELMDKDKLIDDIQSVYDALKDAQKEYTEKGYLSVDTMQALLGLEPKYLALLYDENGQLQLNEQALLKVAEARIIDMGIAQQKAILEQAISLATTGSKNALLEYITVIESATEANKDFVETQLDVLRTKLTARTVDRTETDVDGNQVTIKADLSSSDVENIMSGVQNQLDATQYTVDLGIKGLPKGGLSSSSSDSEKSALEKLQEKYERKISNLDNQQTYLENEIERLEAENKGVSRSYYEEQIDIEEQKMALLQQERTELTKLLNSTKKGSDDWWEIAGALWDVEHAIQESTLRTIEFRESIADLYKTAFEDLDKAYGDKDDLYSDRQAYIEKYMELLELQGEAKPASAYLGLIAEEEAKLANSMAELNDLRQVLADGMANGDIKEGDERWIEMQSGIRETEAAILDSKVALEQYNEELKNLEVEAFEMMRNAFSNRNDYYTNQQDYIEGYIDYLEATGVDATPEMYEKLIAIEKEKRANNVADLANARAGLARLEAAGYTAADEEWIDANNQIVELEKGIQDSDIAMAEWQKTIRELEFEKFDYFAERVSNLNKELENVHKLVEDEDVAFDDGTWTEEGLMSLSTLYHQMEINKKMMTEYSEELAKLEKQYKAGEISEKDYIERADELQDSQWDLIHANEDLKDSIIDINEARIDLVEEGLNEEIDAYRELIELKQEELQAERDLYDFKRDVEKQTKDIAELERKISALSYSDDDSDIAERRKLEAQLREAQESLNDTYFSHAKDSQSKALDDELEAYEKSTEDYLETLRESLENTEAMIQQTFSDVLLNADITYQGLIEISDTYGVALSTNLMNPWQKMSSEATRVKDKIGEDLLVLNEDNIVSFSENITPLLKTPFEQGGLAAEAFKVTTTTEIDQIQSRINSTTSATTREFDAMMANATVSTNTFSSLVESKLTGAVTTAQLKASDMSNALTSPWKNGETAINTWSDTVAEAYSKAVKTAQDSAKAINAANASISSPSYTTNAAGGTSSTGGTAGTAVAAGAAAAGAAAVAKINNIKKLQEVLNGVFNAGLDVDGKYGPSTKVAVHNVQTTLKNAKFYSGSIDGLYGEATKKAMEKWIDQKIVEMKMSALPSSMVSQGIKKYNEYKNKLPTALYAKGTLGTTHDQLAITDESWIGEEITLAAGKSGQLQYLKKGSAVMPADISANLVEWGKINPDTTALANGIQGVNLMSNYVSKPEMNLSFDSLVHVDHCDEGTLKDLEKMVDTKLNQFGKQMNYAIKRYK